MKIMYALIVPVVTLVTLLLVQVSGLSVPMRITMTTGASTDFSVVGEGKVEVVPDTGYVEVGITANKLATAEEAQSTIAAVNDQIVEKMKSFDIEAADIKTTNYSINPNYDWSEAGGGAINGYNGTATLAIKVREPDMFAAVVESAIAAGATDVYNTRFDVEDPAQYREQARTQAIDNAKEQAQKLASQLGIKLGRITNVVESTQSGDNPIAFRTEMGFGGGGAVADMQKGSQVITSTVTLYFEKK